MSIEKIEVFSLSNFDNEILNENEFKSFSGCIERWFMKINFIIINFKRNKTYVTVLNFQI